MDAEQLYPNNLRTINIQAKSHRFILILKNPTFARHIASLKIFFFPIWRFDEKT